MSAPSWLRRSASLARSHPMATLGAFVVVLWLVAGLLAPLLTRYGPLEQSGALMAQPSGDHWFGTDELGRDVFSRVVHGARVSIPAAIVLVVLTVLVGGLLGGIAGFVGGWVDEVVMRLTDLVFAFPGIILAMVVTASIGPGLRNAILAMAIVAWPMYARVMRTRVAEVMQSDFATSSRLLGVSPARVFGRDVLRNVSGPVVVLATVETGTMVLLLSGLSFLGLGSKPPTAEWGLMVSAGAQNFQHWWIGTFPGLAIFTVVLGFNLVGDAVRDLLDPQTAESPVREAVRA